MKVLIGISCNYDYRDKVGRVTHLGADGQDWNFVAGDYVRAIEAAGGIAVLIPKCETPEGATAILDRLDGLLLSGGNDVNPLLYGERIKSCCGSLMPVRDTQETALVVAARERSVPVLGICRGLQVMTVALGGTLYQDVQQSGGFEEHFTAVLPTNQVSHKITLSENSLLHQIFQTQELGVNSFHHQAVLKLPQGAAATACSPDGVIEAVEFSGGNPFLLGVQWHPELMNDSAIQMKLLCAFVKACEANIKEEGTR